MAAEFGFTLTSHVEDALIQSGRRPDPKGRRLHQSQHVERQKFQRRVRVQPVALLNNRMDRKLVTCKARPGSYGIAWDRAGSYGITRVLLNTNLRGGEGVGEGTEVIDADVGEGVARVSQGALKAFVDGHTGDEARDRLRVRA